MKKRNLYLILIGFFFIGGLSGFVVKKYMPVIQVRMIPKEAEIVKGKAYIIDYPEHLVFKQEKRNVPKNKTQSQDIHKESAIPGMPESRNVMWSTFKSNFRRTGRTAFAATDSKNIKWKFRTLSIISSSPSIGYDGTVYVGSFDNALYAIQPTGKLKWRFHTGGAIMSPPTVSVDGTVYFGSNDRNFYAVNPDSTLKWMFATDDIILTSAAIDNEGMIYFGSNDGHLYALDHSGLLKWKFSTGGAINRASPAIGDDATIYFGSGDGFLYAVNTDGSLHWKYQARGSIKSSPAIGDNGIIYFGSTDGYLYAVNPDGSLKWSYDVGSEILSSVAIDSDGTLFFGAKDEYLYALSSDGALKFRFKAGSPVVVSPAIADNGMIFFGTTTGVFHAVTTSGEFLWKRFLGLFQGSPSIGSDGTVYVGSMFHELIAFGPPMPKVNISVNKEALSKSAEDTLSIRLEADRSGYPDTEVKVWMQFPDGKKHAFDAFRHQEEKERIERAYSYIFKNNDLAGFYRIVAGILDPVTGEQIDSTETVLNVH